MPSRRKRACKRETIRRVPRITRHPLRRVHRARVVCVANDAQKRIEPGRTWPLCEQLYDLGLCLLRMISPGERVSETETVLEAVWIAREQPLELARGLVIAPGL